MKRNGEAEEELYMEIPEALEPMLKVLIADGPLGKVNKDILLNTAKRWVNLIQDGKPKAC